MSGTAKKAFLVIILLLVLLTLPFPFVGATEDFWTTKTPMQQARGGLGVAVVDGKIYAIGGQPGSSRSSMNVTEEYDPSTDVWAFKEPMPTARKNFATATYNNKIYCIGGEKIIVTFENGIWNSSEGFLLDVNEVYDPVTDSWETKAPIPIAKKAITATVIDNKIYVVGDQSNELWVYSPETDSWSNKTSLPATLSIVTGGSSSGSIVLDNKIHVIGAFPLANSHQIYDIQNDSWSFGLPVISSYFFAVAGATTGEFAPKRIYVYGTNSQYWDLGGPDFFAQSYDPITGNWTTCASMPTGRINAGVADLNDTIYVIGGYVPVIGNNIYASTANEQYIPVDYVPEFSSWILLPLFLSVTLVVVVLKKRLPQNACILGY